MRGAGQDWYEQGDIWARMADNRPLPQGTPLDRLRGIESGLRRLMTVDASSASTLVSQGGPPPRDLPLEPDRPTLRNTKRPRARGESSSPGRMTKRV
jgi:hypothetical protein